tara:strand:- start:3 stop:593 length:591 start_codon:yes stop_codon:yes gene_type:complete
MSNIKLVHSGGNSVSLTTPTSNPSSNVTFKLPAADGTAGQVLQTDGNGNLTFVNKFADGQVISTVVGQRNGQFSTGSNSLVAISGLSVATPTPESSLNDHLIHVRIADLRKSADNAIQLTVHRNGTFWRGIANFLFDTSSTVQQTDSIGATLLDTTDDSSSVTYQVYYKSATGGTIYGNVGNSTSEIIVQEIKRYS